MALINNLISNLGSKDPNKKLLSNVNDGQTTSTMEGQGFSDSQYDSMAQDFAFQANVKADKARNELRTEYDRVDDVRSNAVKIGKQHTFSDSLLMPSWQDSSGNQTSLQGTTNIEAATWSTEQGGFEDLKFKQPKGKLLNESDIDSLSNPNMYGQGGSSLTGQACNTYSCAIQREAGATVPKDFSFRRRVDGKMIHLKAGDPVPTLPSNEDMDNLYTQMGYEHVQLKDANLVHENEATDSNYFANSTYDYDDASSSQDQVTGLEARDRYKSSIREVDNIEGGDIYRAGFYPSFMKDGSMKSRTSHSMTAGALDKDSEGKYMPNEEGNYQRPFYQNSGYMGSGIDTNYTSRQDEGTYLRYVGNTKDLKKKVNATSFIANATRGNFNKTSKIKPMSGAQITANTTGLNSLFKKLKKK
jgi:hypothetical protein